MLVAEGLLALDDPVERHVGELADRRVLPDPYADLDTAEPADRSVTVEDLLTMRMGLRVRPRGREPRPRPRRRQRPGNGAPRSPTRATAWSPRPATSCASPSCCWAGGSGTLRWSYPEHDTAAVLLTAVVPPAGPLFTAFETTLADTVDR